MAGKERTQEEFFYTLNDLINQGKQIILSSNKSPVELMDLDEKLRSRLGGGLVVDFLPTNFDLRMNILNKKVNVLNFDIPQEILKFLASQFRFFLVKALAVISLIERIHFSLLICLEVSSTVLHYMKR